MALESYEIIRPEHLHLFKDGLRLYGCDHHWYPMKWRQKNGCGPATATNLLLYLNKKNNFYGLPYRNLDVCETLTAMNDVYHFVRPPLLGPHTITQFMNGLEKLSEHYGISYKFYYLKISLLPNKRPTNQGVKQFIEHGIQKDVPIAFFRSASDEKDGINASQWVTIIGIKSDKETGSVLIQAYDQATPVEINLGKWLETSKTGGGFVYLCNASMMSLKSELKGKPNFNAATFPGKYISKF